MTTAVPYAELPWSPRRGDTERTPPIALFTRTGGSIDLAGWTVRAQVRDRRGTLLHTFVRDVGILLGRGEARFADDRPGITTSTVRLRLHPEDWPAIPERLRGAAWDVEVSRAGVVRTVGGGPFDPIEDVTR